MNGVCVTLWDKSLPGSAFFPRLWRLGAQGGTYLAARWWGWILAGAVAALALPPVCCFFVLPFCLWFLFKGSMDAGGWKQALWRGFLFGMGFYTAGLYWLTNAILTRVSEFWWVVPFASPGVSLIIAPLFGLPAACAYFRRESWHSGGALGRWGSILLFSGVWVLADQGRTYIFSGFPWNPLGSVLEFSGFAGTLFMQPAAWIGVDGISFGVVLFSLALFAGARSALAAVLGAGLWAGLSLLRLDLVRPLPVQMPLAAIVQGTVSEQEILHPKDPLEVFSAYLKLTGDGAEEAAAYNERQRSHRPFLVIWPESAFPFLLDESPQAQVLMAQAASGGWVLAGSERREKGAWYNALEAVSPAGRIALVYDKSRLVPFGEYEPWIIPFHVLPGSLKPGPGLAEWKAAGLGRLSPLVCYEIIFSGGVVKSGTRPQWILTISNDAWYSNSAGPWQHLAAGRMRAVEEGLAVAFANNMGPSAIYSPFGRRELFIPWGKEKAALAPVPEPLSPTLFSCFGRFIPFSLALTAAIAGLFLSRESSFSRWKGKG